MPIVIELAVTPTAVAPPLPPLGAAAAGFDDDPEAVAEPPLPEAPVAPELPETAPPADPPEPAGPPVAPALGPVDAAPDGVWVLVPAAEGDAAEGPLEAPPAAPPPDPLPSAAAVADRTSELGTRRPQLLMASAIRARPATRL